MTKKSLYRISFSNQDAVYEIYARSVSESNLFGFIQVEELTFGEQSSLVVDPSEEKLKMEFNEVKRTFIPMHAIFRIDEVSRQGAAKVKDKSSTDSKISHFPAPDSKRKR